MNEMEKLLDDVVNVSECCIIFSTAKNAEGVNVEDIIVKIEEEVENES